MDDNRKKALGAALAQIEKQFGSGSIMRMGDAGAQRDIDIVSTGSLSLDLALGVGGLPREGGNSGAGNSEALSLHHGDEGKRDRNHRSSEERGFNRRNPIFKGTTDKIGDKAINAGRRQGATNSKPDPADHSSGLSWRFS